MGRKINVLKTESEAVTHHSLDYPLERAFHVTTSLHCLPKQSCNFDTIETDVHDVSAESAITIMSF